MRDSGARRGDSRDGGAAYSEANWQEWSQLRDLSCSGAASLTNFFERYSPRLLRLVEIRLQPSVRSRVDPADVIQDAFAEATRVLDEFLEKRPLPVFLWLRKLTLQKITEVHRRHLGAECRSVRKEQQPELPANSGSMAIEFAGHETTPSGVIEEQEMQERLRATLEDLSELDREVLALKHFEQLSTPEAASVLGISEDAVKKRHVRALSRLRKLVNRGESP